MTVTQGAKAPDKPQLVSLTIDDEPVQVPKGTLIIRAAEMAGIAIPRFCDHPLLKPAGACRQCLVDVATPGPDGNMRPFPKPQPSCTMTVSEGMEVHTQATSAAAERAQRGVMELLLINHPLDCPICDKGGECPLQNQAMTAGRASSRFIDTKRTFPKPIKVSAQILLDRERCVLCQRCTRFQSQIAGDPFIALQNRGARQQIGTFSVDVLDFAGDEDDADRDFPLAEDGRPFSSYFSGNTVQICPVGALTSAAYRFRARPFDLVSTPAIAEHDASGAAIRVDYRRGHVLRRLAGNDPAVNEEWITDKDRFAFRWQDAPDRLTGPLVRHDGELRPASWPEALRAAANGLAASDNGVGVLAGGRLTVENAYAYSKFARLVLGTNDIDFRARPHSAEEADFLAAAVAGRFEQVTFADLEHANGVLLAGFEPEEEGGIVFLRLRKGGRPVFSIAPYASRGLTKLGGTLLPTAPGSEAHALAALTEDASGVNAQAATALRGGVIIVGERLATSPGALSAALAAADRLGARLAWIARRIGERGALEAGALPGLLPGGRLVADATARAEVAAAWGAQSLPERPGRDLDAMLNAAQDGSLGSLVIGGVELDDLPDPALALRAVEACNFVISLEVRTSAVTELADVVLPVAPPNERHGTYLNWEGRWRPDPQVLVTRSYPDAEVLGLIAQQLGRPFGSADFAALLSELRALGPASSFPAPPTVAAANGPRITPGHALLASWRLLLDAGRCQDGDVHLAATAKAARAAIGQDLADALGIAAGEPIRVSTPAGAIELPTDIVAMTDNTVWLPGNSAGSRLRSTLHAGPGDLVAVAKGGQA